MFYVRFFPGEVGRRDRGLQEDWVSFRCACVCVCVSVLRMFVDASMCLVANVRGSTSLSDKDKSPFVVIAKCFVCVWMLFRESTL